MRCDLFLAENGYVKSRTKARELIDAGNVKINGNLVKKPSDPIDESVENTVEILCDCPFVGRGGLKLEHALSHFDISV